MGVKYKQSSKNSSTVYKVKIFTLIQYHEKLYKNNVSVSDCKKARQQTSHTSWDVTPLSLGREVRGVLLGAHVAFTFRTKPFDRTDSEDENPLSFDISGTTQRHIPGNCKIQQHC